MIPKEYCVELGTSTIQAKGNYTRTLTVPKPWMRYAKASLGDEYLVLTDTRDNSLHYYLKSKSQSRKAHEEKAS